MINVPSSGCKKLTSYKSLKSIGGSSKLSNFHSQVPVDNRQNKPKESPSKSQNKSDSKVSPPSNSRPFHTRNASSRMEYTCNLNSPWKFLKMQNKLPLQDTSVLEHRYTPSNLHSPSSKGKEVRQTKSSRYKKEEALQSRVNSVLDHFKERKSQMPQVSRSNLNLSRLLLSKQQIMVF